MELYDPRPTVAIPDLNGKYERFLLAIEHAPPTEHFLILLGDMIDDGSGVQQILRHLREIHAEHGLQVLAGNHEELMINALCGLPGMRHAIDPTPGDTPEWRRWLRNGGRATLESYRSKRALISDVEWLIQHSKRWVVRHRWLYSHATRPHPAQQPLSVEQLTPSGADMLLWDRPTGTANLYALPENLIGSVHGHTPRPIPERLLGPDRKPAWFIDLGKQARDIAVHHSETGPHVLHAPPLVLDTRPASPRFGEALVARFRRKAT
ncbi:metallophosphoesterase (plasmid) [Deinococcus sp. KNUC1210]|uniref:metallophosphoesterase n=1 Tax=Deinococcus sp. KNUC1210 TaxID=2917691 RepID=UPI001EEFD328|nr:metallophosphoesterase [Deinococcus sp. KNUC1210]ULH17979.1 metallophosphoesterase [Deinococcus sp. KNUC1210]